MMPEAQRMPEPEAQVFTSNEATHGPNPNPMPQGIQLYDAPYSNPSDPFVDDHMMPSHHLHPEQEGMGLLRPNTALSGSTQAPSGTSQSVSGDDDIDQVRLLPFYVSLKLKHIRIPLLGMVEYPNAFQEDTRLRSVSNFKTVTSSLIVQFLRDCWTCVITEKATSLPI